MWLQVFSSNDHTPRCIVNKYNMHSVDKFNFSRIHARSVMLIRVVVLLLASHRARGECWDTGCQPDAWAVRGCEQYGMAEVKSAPCEGRGFVYSCCHRDQELSTGLTRVGDLTYYDLGLTACGRVHRHGEMVAAVAFGHFTTPNPNKDPMCGKRVKIVDPTTSKSVEVTVQDKCEACKMNDIDVSVTAFEKLKPRTVGRFKVVWDFI